MTVVSLVLALSGAALLVFGVSVVAWPAGVAVLGVGLLAAGLLLDFGDEE